MLCLSRVLRPLLCVCAVAIASCGAAHAQVSFTLSPNTYNAPNTGTITLTGYITNNTTATVFLNDLFVQSFAVTGGTINTASFFGFAPASLAAGSSYGSVTTPANIVTVTTNNAPNQSVDSNTITLGTGPDASTVVTFSNASFSLVVIPEAGTLSLLGAGSLGLVAVARRRRAA